MRFLSREIGRDGTTIQQMMQLIIFGIVVFAVTAGVVLVEWTPGQTSVQVGEIAKETFKAPDDATFISDIRTEEQRKKAFDSVENIVKTQDDNVRTEQLTALSKFLADADEIRAENSTETEQIAQLKLAREGLDSAEAESILALSESAWADVKAESVGLVDETMAEPIQSDQVNIAIADLPNQTSSLLTTTQRELATAISTLFITPNVFIDDEATQTKRQQASDAVTPVQIEVKSGQAIVRDGDEVTAVEVEALEKLGLLRSSQDFASRVGSAGLMAILTLALVVYLYLFNRDVWRDRQLVLVGLVVLVPVVLARLVLPDNDLQYMFPVAASAMLLAILMNIQFAAVIAALIALYIGVATTFSFELTLTYYLGALAGAFLIWRAVRTMTFIWSGVGVALAMFGVAICFQIINEQVDALDASRLLLETGVAGALAASITFLSFSILGSLFGITTHLQLQELAHPNQELLLRLAHEAPGTYHHSLLVGNLAASAAVNVGGDPLFARVAALYHDIGKMKHPTFFIENQANLENVHNSLEPSVSSKIIIDHVPDGVKMARKARLPRQIIDVIAQHHGTTRTEYFYRQALANGDDPDEADYRYAGPKPQTRETAIIMLSDSVESAVRSMAQSNRLFAPVEGQGRDAETNQLVSVVDSVIQSKIDDGQLDECPLTFNDIQKIKATFVQILEGIYHPRIEYPAEVKPGTTESQRALHQSSTEEFDSTPATSASD